MAAVAAAVSASKPVPAAPPTTSLSSPSAPVCELSERESGSPVSVETVDRT